MEETILFGLLVTGFFFVFPNIDDVGNDTLSVKKAKSWGGLAPMYRSAIAKLHERPKFIVDNNKTYHLYKWLLPETK